MSSENVSGEFDSVFTKKVIKSRNSYIIWIPKDDAEYLELDEKTFLRVGIRKLPKKTKNVK